MFSSNYFFQIVIQKDAISVRCSKIIKQKPKKKDKNIVKKNHKRYNFSGRMDNKMNYTYDGKFEEKILLVGRNGCGKTTFVQNLGKYQLFGDIKEILWISKISLSTERQNNIGNVFVNQHVDFLYPNDIVINI